MTSIEDSPEKSPKVLIFGALAGDVRIDTSLQALPGSLADQGFTDTKDLTPDYMGNDYHDWLLATSSDIEQLSQEHRLYLLAFSAGVIPALSLYLRHQGIIDRAVLHSGKIMSTYAFENPETAKIYKNLTSSSDQLQQDIAEFSSQTFLPDVLCTRGRNDRMIDPSQSVLLDRHGRPLTHEHTFLVDGHAAILAHAMTDALDVTVNFLQTGLLPSPGSNQELDSV